MRKNRILFCFMGHMMAHGDPEPGMVDCLNRFWADQSAIREIMYLKKGIKIKTKYLKGMCPINVGKSTSNE
jgi:hypothetical protein